jgi:serine/threonine-protein kinase
MSNSQSEPNELFPGKILARRYVIQQFIGRGSLGRTYLACDRDRFNELCVIKEFAPIASICYDLAGSKEQFIREAKILNHLDHPQIPKFFGYFEAERRFCLVQEYIQGQSYGSLLQQRLKQNRVLLEPEIIALSFDLLPVIEYIHEKGVIHRDISPDNIIQPDRQSLPVLIDFGVGKLILDRNREIIGNSKSFVGKVGYAPHEQINLGLSFPSNDLYALGVTAIVLLTGKHPTALLNRKSLGWEWQQYAKVSEPLAQILDRAIALDIKQRYQSASEMDRDLQAKAINVNTVINRVERTSKSQETLILERETSQDLISNPAPTKLPQQQSEVARLDDLFIKRCQQELTYCLGIRAKSIVDRTLATTNFRSPAKFVAALAQNIPDPETAQWFTQRLL